MESAVDNKAIDIEEKRVEIERKRDDWYICCSHSSASLIKFTVQITICLLILIFSFYQIIRNQKDDNSMYFSLISIILGYIIPSPSLIDKKQ